MVAVEVGRARSSRQARGGKSGRRCAACWPSAACVWPEPLLGRRVVPYPKPAPIAQCQSRFGCAWPRGGESQRGGEARGSRGGGAGPWTDLTTDSPSATSVSSRRSLPCRALTLALWTSRRGTARALVGLAAFAVLCGRPLPRPSAHDRAVSAWTCAKHVPVRGSGTRCVACSPPTDPCRRLDHEQISGAARGFNRIWRLRCWSVAIRLNSDRPTGQDR